MGHPHAFADHSTYRLDQWAVPTGSVNMNTQWIINLTDPVVATDAANKKYVDNAIGGLSWKGAVRAATTTNITLSAPQTIDGVALVFPQRVLVKDQTTQSQNGIYTIAAGAWIRATDADTASEIEGMAAFVMEGTVNADTSWVCTANTPITVDTTALTFAQFSGGGTVTAGAGMTQSGNTLNVIAGDTSLTVAADSVIVNTAVIASVASLATYPKKFSVALTGTTSPETVTHNLNTQDILVMVHNGSTPFTAIEVDWDATTVNTAVIRYNPNIGAGYRAVVVG
jgi:phage-related tail fiber protein